jgi:hypothetical protein
MDPNVLIDAAFDVCTALDSVGTKAVLTGGSAATFYAPHAYQSDDIDFVLAFGSAEKSNAEVLGKIGFVLAKGKQHYERDGVVLEFPKGPLSVGGEVLPEGRYFTAKNDHKVLYVLTATDAVCNRLESYYAWNDFSARAAAISIVLAQTAIVDLQKIRDWTEREYRRVKGQQKQRFNEFLHVLRRLNVQNVPEDVPA